MAYIKSFDGTKIYYRIKKKSNRFLVFLHGWPHNHTVWEKEWRFFEKRGYSTLAPDLRGHGKSGKPQELKDYSFDNFAKDINLVIKKEKITNFVLIGHSFGGMVALSYYALFPKRIKANVLLDTIYENPLKHIPFLKYFKLTPLTEHVLKFILRNQKVHQKHHPYVDFSKLKDHADFYYWLKGAEETPVKSILACLEEMLEFNKKQVLKKIKVPTLILEGEKDTKTAVKDVKLMARHIKNSKLVIIGEATHDINIRTPRAVEKSVLQFLNNIGYA